MTSIIRLQPFNGVDGEGPPCYMLQLDEFRFLLDCGWNPDFDMGYIENIKKHIHQIDAVLLSHPDPYHLGALPYLVGKAGLSCPIYATIPVYKMGQMFMYDLFQSRHNTEAFELFTLDDVDSAFDKIMQLKYSQTVGLKGKGHGLQITPLSAGHMIGGTIWKIVKDGEEEIVYAVDYNHKKERHLNGCVLEQIIRPSILITDAFNANYTQVRRRMRDEQLMTNIMQTLRNDGNVLITVDSAGRVLELAHLLDQMWRTPGSGLIAYSLALLNNVSYNVVEFAKSQVEWMSDKIQRAFEDQRNNPFQFKHLQLCHSIAELNKVPSPKVVLASTPDMQCGFSRDLFFQWSSNPKNTVIITQKTSPGTLARWLVDHPDQTNITLKMNRRVRLEGAELEAFKRKQKEKNTEAAKRQTQAKTDNEEMVSSDESDDDDITDGTNTHDLMSKAESKSRHGFFKQSKKSYPMYPVVEERIKWDDYGEIIKIEDFQMLDQGAEEVASAQPTKDSAAQEEEIPEIQEVPTKCISTSHSIDILARIVYIDFEGRSDGDSIRNILAKIKPRHLILVHGSFDATASLADYARTTKDVVQGNVYTPSLHELIDATTESHIYQARLKDSVVSALKFSKARDTELAWIDGMIDISKENSDFKGKQENNAGDEDDESMDVVPTLVPLPSSDIPFHSAVYVNEPRLSDFKQVLVEEGITAEFSGGVLICNNQVAIRRNEAGKMLLEGTLCPDFYLIQDLLYKQYAII